MLQETDERFGDRLQADEEIRLNYHVTRFDTLATARDTLGTLMGQWLRLRYPATERTYTMPAERPFAARPMWASGHGWLAFGHGADSLAAVQLDGGGRLAIEWPRDDRPLARPDFEAFLDQEFEAFRRTESERVVEQLDDVDRDAWINEELAHWEARPQATVLLGSGRCLLVGGFRPDAGPLGESSDLVLVNVEGRSVIATLRLPDSPGFLRGFGPGLLFRIVVDELGQRRVEALAVEYPECWE